MKGYRAFAGFTLAELLISLALLGIISTFSIGKVLTAQQNAQKKAIFKETYAAIAQVMHTAWMTGEFDGGAGDNIYAVFAKYLNHVKACSTNSDTQGCWSSTSVGASDEPGFVMHNGAFVVGFNGIGNWQNNVAMDWNGSSGPNLLGDDIWEFWICAGTWCNGTPAGNRNLIPVPIPTNTTSVNYYYDMFSN